MRAQESPVSAGVQPRVGMDSSRQKQHYTAIHDAYEAHYYDAPSMAYRSRFIYRWLFDGVDFRGAEVADLACGSGYNSVALERALRRRPHRRFRHLGAGLRIIDTPPAMMPTSSI